jgi:hypothetical protein
MVDEQRSQCRSTFPMALKLRKTLSQALMPFSKEQQICHSGAGSCCLVNAKRTGLKGWRSLTTAMI